MRIGLEMFGTQTGGRDRGIGRYARNLAAAIRVEGAAAGHDFVCYAVDGLPTGLIPEGPNVLLRRLRPEPHLRHTLSRLVNANPDGLDVLIFINPLEMNPGLDIPTHVSEGTRPALVAVVHDLIPFLFQDRYLRRWPGASFARRYLWGLERLRTYDRLLTNSEATRSDLLRLLNLPGDRVVTVGAAGDDLGCDFGPDADDLTDRDLLRGLGVKEPFVLTVAGPDPHKNLDGLLDAFALLPVALRSSYSLVVAAGSAEPEKLDAVHQKARSARVFDRLVLLSRPVDDSALRALYRRCAAFVFPSLYEGFGLPVLEALRCGAAVVAGDGSSLPEVAGDAAVLVNASDPNSIASGLASVLTDDGLARSLRAKGPVRAALFSWDAVAGRVLKAVSSPFAPRPGVRDLDTRFPPRPACGERAGVRGLDSQERVESGRPLPPARSPRRGSRGSERDRRPRLAVFSPLPPHPSGIANYTSSLLEHLSDYFSIDVFHDHETFPLLRFQRRDLGCYDHRLFARFDGLRPYHAVVYQMGNSPAHFFMEETLRRRPGVVVLHDLALASYHYERATGLDAFRAALARSAPGREREFDRRLALWSDDPQAMVRGLTNAGFDMNGDIVAAARTVVVHSLAAARRLGPSAVGKTVVVPHGADPSPRPTTPDERALARARLGLPTDSLIVGNYGIVHPTKQNAAVVEAFAALARELPTARLIVVGEEADGGLTRSRAEALGLGARIRFLGRLDDERFLASIIAADLGVALRRPPTNGETSGALLHLLRAGVPVVASDTGSFSEYPEPALRKISWPDDIAGASALTEALRALARDAGAREALGRAGREHVRANHSWALVAERYAAAILGGALFRGPRRVGNAEAISRRPTHEQNRDPS